MKTKRQTDQDKTHYRGTVAPTPSFGRAALFPLILLAAVLALGMTSVRASDPIGVFAKIDKVVLEPSDAAPERIQLWGAFCLADEKDRDSYLPPQKGFLYYKLPAEKSDAARKEWNDLKAKAGTGEVIGFGSRFAAKAKVRKADEKPENPDAYPVAFGLVKSDRRGSNYGPVKALQSGEPSKPAQKSP